jgi:hypothetical protein
VLEAYQTLYWLLLLAVAAGDRYDDVRPHEVLAPGPHVGRTTASHAFGVEIALLPQVPDPRQRQQALRERLAILTEQCHIAGVAVEAPVQRDLAELRSRPYLAPYWDAHDHRS